MTTRTRLLMTAATVPLVLAAGLATSHILSDNASLLAPPALAQCGAAKCNPCAAANPCNPCAAANPCNPCAAANPCNPCAAANPCNPCAAGGGAVSQNCVVPRLAQAAAANPCAVAKSNPCAAKSSACNPCAVKASACSPCAAANPCAAESSACNPCAVKASACSPCAAANPCAAAKANPCAAANPCNPCAAANPCNPCGAAAAVELSDAEAVEVYDCLLKEMKAAYAKSDHEIAVAYASWERYSTQPYQSATHGSRYVQNYANAEGRAYGNFEKAGRMPPGTQLAKDSFTVRPDGHAVVGPLFTMEKMQAGFNPDSGDWRYTMVMPDGSIMGTTGGRGSANMTFCYECHMAIGEETDSMLFMPAEYRRR